MKILKFKGFIFLSILISSCINNRNENLKNIQIQIFELDSINLDFEKDFGKVTNDMKCELYNDIALKDYFFDLSNSHNVSLDSLKRIHLNVNDKNYIVPLNYKFSDGKNKYCFIKYLKNASCYIINEKLDSKEVDINEMIIINTFSLKRYYLSNSYSDCFTDFPIESKNGKYILFYENYDDEGLKSNVYIFKKNKTTINIYSKIKLDFNIRNALWIENNMILIETINTNEIINYHIVSF